MSKEIQQITAVINKCRTAIPGGATPADAAAIQYLIRRLQGEHAGESVVLISTDMFQVATRYGDAECKGQPFSGLTVSFTHNKPELDELF